MQWSTVLRQISLYAGYFCANAWVVFAMFPITDTFATPLRSQGLIVLGPKDISGF